MAKTDIPVKNARLVIQDIPVERVLVRTVVRNNNTSGKITLPKDLIDKKVYVVTPK